MALFIPTGRDAFYCRIAVPFQLQAILNRKEVWRSMRTTDQDLAQVRADRWKASAKELFFNLKRYGSQMTKSEIEILVQRWLDSALDEAEQSTPLPITDAWRMRLDHDLMTHYDSLMENLLSHQFDRMTEDADELLKDAGLPTLDHGSVVFKQLCKRLLEAHLEYTRRLQHRLDGGYQPFNEHGTFPQVTSPTVSHSSSRLDESPTRLFSEVVKLYYDENKPRSKRSAQQVQSELKRFTVVIGGDKPIGQITKDQCRAYKEHLMKERKQALVTVVKWLGIVSTIFRWAIRQGFVPDHFKNPMEGLAPNTKRAKAESKSHRDYTDQELLAVFSSKIFLEQRCTRPERYWLCLICLFSGCRREEGAQLLLRDIQEIDGIPCFNFTDEGDDQGLKNTGSRRKVPIHSSLIQLGFLDYVNNLRLAGETRVFPTLKKGKSTFADAVGKWYKRLLKRVGLRDETLVLHGLRHSFITRLSDAGVPEKIKMMLAGHAAQGVHGKVYDHRERVAMKLLQEGLEKLRYDAVVDALLSGTRSRKENAFAMMRA